MKKFICGLLAGAILCSGVVFGANYVAENANFKVFVNGQEFKSDQPALAVDGRTYLPLRAMGDAFGIPVNWNEQLGQVELGNTTRVGFYKENYCVPDYGYLFGKEAGSTVTDDSGMLISVQIFYDYTSNLDALDKDIATYKDILLKNGFVLKEDKYYNFDEDTYVEISTKDKSGKMLEGCLISFTTIPNFDYILNNN